MPHHFHRIIRRGTVDYDNFKIFDNILLIYRAQTSLKPISRIEVDNNNG